MSGRLPRNADRRALLRTRPIPNIPITEPIRPEFNSLVAVVLGGPRSLNSAHHAVQDQTAKRPTERAVRYAASYDPTE